MSDDGRLAALKAAVRDVPDFPKAGVVFKDITPLLGRAEHFRTVIDLMAEAARPAHASKVVAIESRGFIVGSALADRLGLGFVPVRKPGKLPYARVSRAYELEYGQDRLEIHEDALRKGERALVVDDVIATGGTARATAELVEQVGARVAGILFLVELTFLNGRDRLSPWEVTSLLRY
jgi:adenine phosphoribosyltransferase